MTEQEIIELLKTPAALFFVMLLGSLGSALNQLAKASREGKEVSFRAYIKYWPETGAMIIGNTFAFITLLIAGQLNFAAAVGIGWVANSVADQIRPQGRTSMGNGSSTPKNGG